jgi:cytochrome c oxidase subunit 4
MHTPPAVAHDSAHAHAHSGHSERGHVVPLWLLGAVFGGLILLTWATVAVTYVDLGSFNIVIAVGIAFVKAVFVALYFMHLRWDNPFNAIALIASLLFVSLFIVFAIIDTSSYKPVQRNPAGFAPAQQIEPN